MLTFDRSSLARPATAVAPDLLGWELVFAAAAGEVGGIITETEAYLGTEDPASHAFGGPTNRNRVMFGPPGHAYIYFTYGLHYCLNVVTGAAGEASAVLIRALEPTRGIELMQQRRGVKNLTDLATGPAKLTQALGLDTALNGHDLLTPPLQLLPGPIPPQIKASPRIGITQAKDRPWRFTIKNHEHLSRKPIRTKTG